MLAVTTLACTLVVALRFKLASRRLLRTGRVLVDVFSLEAAPDVLAGWALPEG